MKNPVHRTTSRRRSALILAGSIGALLGSFSPFAQAALLKKANNTDDLNLITSWSGGVVPTPADIAWWDGTLLGANSVLLGANLSWGGISITNPGGAVTIGAGNTLTLGTSGIDMSAATQNLTISSALTIGAGNQVWNVAAGRTLTLNTGAFSRGVGATLTILGGAGTVATTNIANVATLGIVGQWAVISSAGVSANNSASGYTFATVSGENIVAYTGATALTTTGAVTWGGMGAGGTGLINYDTAVTGTGSAAGSTRNVNTIRYTGTGFTQGGVTLTINGLMNAGTGLLTVAQPLAIGANGNELVVAAMSAPIALTAAISNNGANISRLVVMGSNTVSLTGTSTYTGGTFVNGGTLLVSVAGAINSSSGITIIGSGAKYVHTSSVASTRAITLTQGTLDGTGTVGAVTVGNGTAGIVTHGFGGSGALTMSSLAFGGAATVNVTLGGTTPFVVTGALTTTPANGQVTINGSGTWLTGLNNLISFGTFAGGLASNFTAGTITGLNGRQSLGGIQLNGSNVALNINGDNPVWSGANGGIWTTGTTNVVGGTPSWALKTALAATDFWVGDNTEFNDTVNLGAGPVAPATTTVTIQGGSVSPGATTFNNSAVNYTVATTDGSGIAAGSLSKSGTGMVTLKTVNTYTGVTTINAGTLRLGDGTTDGSLAAAANITNNASLVYNLVGTSPAYTGVISGTGSITKSGNGTLILKPTPAVRRLAAARCKWGQGQPAPRKILLRSALVP